MESNQISLKERMLGWLRKLRWVLAVIWLVGVIGEIASASMASATAESLVQGREWIFGGIVILVAFFMIVSVLTNHTRQ